MAVGAVSIPIPIGPQPTLPTRVIPRGMTRESGVSSPQEASLGAQLLQENKGCRGSGWRAASQEAGCKGQPLQEGPGRPEVILPGAN